MKTKSIFQGRNYNNVEDLMHAYGMESDVCSQLLSAGWTHSCGQDIARRKIELDTEYQKMKEERDPDWWKK